MATTKKDLTFENSFLYSHIYFRKTKCEIKMSLKPFSNNVKSMAIGQGVKALGQGRYGYKVKMYPLLEKISCST